MLRSSGRGVALHLADILVEEFRELVKATEKEQDNKRDGAVLQQQQQRLQEVSETGEAAVCFILY